MHRLVAVRGILNLPLCTSQIVPCVSNFRVIVKRVGGCVWNSRFHWRWTSATFSNLIYHFIMDFRSSNVNHALAIFFHYHTSYVTWSYSHASSDICWENTILHIVMTIQFNFENNTQIPSVKVCIHFFGRPCICAKDSIKQKLCGHGHADGCSLFSCNSSSCMYMVSTELVHISRVFCFSELVFVGKFTV